MNRFRLQSLAIAVGTALMVATGVAHAGPKTLEDLLKQTRDSRAEQERRDAEREKEFLAAHDKQAGLLEKARAAAIAAEARSKAVSEAFDANEKVLAEKEDLLNQRLGTLGELFGVVRQVAGDTSPLLFNSLISAEHRGRDGFFAGLSKTKSLPTTPELERLWFELQREMTESGRVVRFRGEVVEADGKPAPAEVVRIGPFVAMSNGRYLTYTPTLGLLSVLPRQPDDSLVELAVDLQASSSGYLEAPVDPSRGVLLSMIVQRPDILERIEKGESVGYLIIVVGVIGLVLSIYQAFYLFTVRGAVKRQLGQLDRPADDNPLGRVLAVARTSPETVEEDAEVIELRISEAVLREVPRLERFQPFLRLAVAAGPLLGLIGTVVGMIITFQSITESGSSDPRLMANGIGQAMIATVLGLGIAVPLLFINAGLASMSRYIVQVLDEQSAGLLAGNIEKARGRA